MLKKVAAALLAFVVFVADVDVFFACLVAYAVFHLFYYVQSYTKPTPAASKIMGRLRDLKVQEDENAAELYEEVRKKVYKRYLKRAGERLLELESRES